MKSLLNLNENLKGNKDSFMYSLWENSIYDEIKFKELINDLVELRSTGKEIEEVLGNRLGGELFHMIASLVYSHTVANLLYAKKMKLNILGLLKTLRILKFMLALKS